MIDVASWFHLIKQKTFFHSFLTMFWLLSIQFWILCSLTGPESGPRTPVVSSLILLVWHKWRIYPIAEVRWFDCSSWRRFSTGDGFPHRILAHWISGLVVTLVIGRIVRKPHLAIPFCGSVPLRVLGSWPSDACPSCSKPCWLLDMPLPLHSYTKLVIKSD